MSDMKNAHLSDAQARATALDPSRSFCVTAPAGSGKTELLTQRILALLPRVRRPEQVLAITFTRKAAAEMRERLVLKLQEAAAGKAVAAEHEQRTRELALAVLAHAEQQGWSLDPEQFNLRTIDSLCGELTRQMPILSGIGGAVAVTDQHRPLFERAVTELLAYIEQPGPIGEALQALLLHFDNDWSRLRELLVKLLERRGDWGGRLGLHHTPDESRSTVEHTVAQLVESVLTRATALIGDELESVQTLATFAADNLGIDRPVLKPTADRVSDWQQAIGFLIKSDNKDWYKSWTKNHGFPADAKEEKSALAELVAGLKAKGAALFDVLLEIRSLPTMLGDDASWSMVLHLSQLLPVLLAQLLLVFKQEDKVDFTHLALAAEDALGPDSDPTDLALRLDYQLEHILVDEFQDTSDQQFRLLRKLTRGWAEHNNTEASPQTLFIVGDGMQSIYGFRYANVGLFLEARREGVGGVHLEPLALTRNFRSQQGVVDWVNRVFKQLLPSEDEPSRGQVRHVWAEASHETLPGPAVESHIFADDKGWSEADYLADRIVELRECDPEASIAVLVRARRHVLPLIDALQSRGIGYVGRDLENLRNTPAVTDLLTLCRWLANPADEVASLALLRAPFCGLKLVDIHALTVGQPRPLSLIRLLDQGMANADRGAISADGLDRIPRLHRALLWAEEQRDRLSLPVWVEQIWLRLGGHRVLTDTGYRDAERFFDLLRKGEFEGVGLDVDWLNLRLEQLFAEHEVTGNPVELMTIHKSKGLQFDYVFMPQLHKTVGGSDRALLRWHLHLSDGEEGLVIAADDRQQKNDPSLYNYLSWLQRQKDTAELRRLLYVGVTRAKRKVWLCAEATDDKEWPNTPSPNSPMGVLMQATADEVQFHERPLNALEPDPSGLGSVSNSDSGLPLIRIPSMAFAPLVDDARQQTGHGAVGIGADLRNGLYRTGNYRERVVGITLHRVLELLTNRGELPSGLDQPLRAAIEFNLRARGLSGSNLLSAQADVADWVRRTLADERGQWILSQRQWAFSELDVVTLKSFRADGTEGAQAQELQRQVIDRVLYDDQLGEWWIVDYKTSRPDSNESIAAFYQRECDHYRVQLEGYIAVLKDYLESLGQMSSQRLMHNMGLESEPVIKAALYFPAFSGWVELQ